MTNRKWLLANASAPIRYQLTHDPALPATEYAVFDVYVAKGYESGNADTKQWLALDDALKSNALLALYGSLVDGQDCDFTGTKWEREWLADGKICHCPTMHRGHQTDKTR